MTWPRPHGRPIFPHHGKLCPVNIVVTGASGFLGSHVAARLAGDHVVHGLGRSFDLERRRGLESSGVRLHRVDLTDATDAPALEALLDDADAVIHCAAMSTLWGREQDLRRVNVDATAWLAQASARRGLRFVHISSPSIYNRAVHDDPGLGTPARPIEEDTAVGPKFDSAYARSKWHSEEAVREHAPGACILRPRGIYGPGDVSILPRVIRALEAGRLPRLTDGEVVTHLTHVENAAHAAALAVAVDVSGSFNIADDEPLPIWANIDRIADALDVPRPHRRVPAGLVEGVAAAVEFVARHLPGRPEPRLTATGVRLLTTGMLLDLTRARDLLGYRPVHTTGLDPIIEALRP